MSATLDPVTIATPKPSTGSSVVAPEALLDPGMCLTLRPMKYPQFYDMFRDGIKNTWTVEEVDFSTDLVDLRSKMSPAEIHTIKRLVAFFATGDSIVSNNLVLNLYKHVNSPEARLYLSRQLFEEAVHVQFYLTLLDNYVPDHDERAEAFAAVENIPSIMKKADFCMKWMDSIEALDTLQTREHRRNFLLNLICFASCIEGLFFFAAFAYVYFFRSKGLLHGLASGTNWVFRDESCHLEFAFEVVNVVRQQEPDLWDAPPGRADCGDAGGGRGLRGAVCRGPAFRRCCRPVCPRYARLPGIRGRQPPAAHGDRAPLQDQEPVQLYGTAGRAGADELL